MAGSPAAEAEIHQPACTECESDPKLHAETQSDDAVAETAALHSRLKAAGLDGKAVAYLTDSVEIELDFARLRLT